MINERTLLLSSLKFFLIFSVFKAFTSNASIIDHYSSYTDLASHAIEGKDFTVTAKDTPQAKILIEAIHGGIIEPGTEALAREIDLQLHQNLYVFSAKKEDLHITSHHFDDPRLLTLAAKSDFCLSIHGEGSDPETPTACIGGENTEAGKKIKLAINHFKEMKIKTEMPCKKFQGIHPKNVVNLCRNHGVQLELSWPLLKKIQADKIFRKKFSTTLINALKEK